MKILIVGLGVIGGGYAMALKEAGYSEVYGIDTNEETLKKAKEMKIIKEGFTREDEIISEMDLIVLAIYPNLVKNFIVKNNLNMIKIESRPSNGELWEYVLYVDLEGNINDEKVKNAINLIKEETRYFKLLGCYKKKEGYK